jgi:hypothetical protein
VSQLSGFHLKAPVLPEQAINSHGNRIGL